MDRWNALELLILAVILFAYFVPVVSIPLHCVHCPIEPQYGSLTYVYLGHGATWAPGIYSVRP